MNNRYEYLKVMKIDLQGTQAKPQMLKQRVEEYFKKCTPPFDEKRVCALLDDLPEIFSKPQNLACYVKHIDSIPKALEFPPIFKREFTLADFIRLFSETEFMIHSAWYENIEGIYSFTPLTDEQKRRLIDGFKMGKCAKMFSGYLQAGNGPMATFIMEHYKNYAPSDIFTARDIESVYTILKINQLFEAYELNVLNAPEDAPFTPEPLKDFGMFPGGFELGFSNPNIMVYSCDKLACHECKDLYTSPFVTINSKIEELKIFDPEHLYSLVLNVQFDDETCQRIVEIVCKSIYVKSHSLDILKIAKELGYLHMAMDSSMYLRTRHTLDVLQIYGVFYEVDLDEYTYLWDQVVECRSLETVFYEYIARLMALEHVTNSDMKSLTLYKTLNPCDSLKYTTECDPEEMD